MTLKNLAGRVTRIGAECCAPDACEGGPTVWLFYHSGEQQPPVPPNAARCPKCGAVHPLFVKEIVVDRNARGERVEFRQNAAGEWVEHGPLSAEDRADGWGDDDGPASPRPIAPTVPDGPAPQPNGG